MLNLLSLSVLIYPVISILHLQERWIHFQPDDEIDIDRFI